MELHLFPRHNQSVGSSNKSQILSKADKYGNPLIDIELINQLIDKRLAEIGIKKDFIRVFANPDNLKDPESLPEVNRLIDLVMEDLKGMVLEATGKKYQGVLRNLRNAINDGLLLKLAQGRPTGSVTDVRNSEIKLMNDTLFYGATYEDEDGNIHSQYRHYDTRTKEDLSVWEIYYTIAEYYPELAPISIKDIVNKKTI